QEPEARPRTQHARKSRSPRNTAAADTRRILPPHGRPQRGRSAAGPADAALIQCAVHAGRGRNPAAPATRPASGPRPGPERLRPPPGSPAAGAEVACGPGRVARGHGRVGRGRDRLRLAAALTPPGAAPAPRPQAPAQRPGSARVALSGPGAGGRVYLVPWPAGTVGRDSRHELAPWCDVCTRFPCTVSHGPLTPGPTAISVACRAARGSRRRDRGTPGAVARRRHPPRAR